MSDTTNNGILLNPAGQEVTPLVREVMERCGIEQGEVKFLQKGTWLHASERSAVVAVETSQRTRAALGLKENVSSGNKGGGSRHERNPALPDGVKPKRVKRSDQRSGLQQEIDGILDD